MAQKRISFWKAIMSSHNSLCCLGKTLGISLTNKSYGEKRYPRPVLGLLFNNLWLLVGTWSIHTKCLHYNSLFKIILLINLQNSRFLYGFFIHPYFWLIIPSVLIHPHLHSWNFSIEPPEKTMCRHFDFSSLRIILNFWPPELVDNDILLFDTTGCDNYNRNRKLI